MSARFLNWAWAFPGLSRTERLMLVALADDARNEPLAYPSMARLRERTGMAERTLQGAAKRLCEKGAVALEIGGGRGRCNAYRLNVNPADDAGFDAAETPQMTTQNPADESRNPADDDVNPAAPAPGTNRTKEPEENPVSRRVRAPALASQFPASVRPEVAAAFVAHRRAMRKPLGERAVALLGNSLAEIAALGIDPNDALDLAIERGWQTVKPEWAARELGPKPGGPDGPTSRPANPRQAADQARTDRLLELARRRNAERGQGGSEGSGGPGVACRPGDDGPPPLLRIASG